MHRMYVGGVGQGKSFCAVAFCDEAPKEEFKNVFANVPVNVPGKNCTKWQDFSEIKDATCGVLYLDEADMWINSRNFATLDATARDVLKEHRKHHLRIVSTTQHVSFVDKVFRILCDEVCVVKRYSVPFLGLLDSDTIRPSIVCKCCNVIRSDDGRGDDDKWWKRWLYFGTFYMWKTYPPSVLGEDESANATETEAKEIPSTGWGWKRFSLRIANMYDTSARASVDAHERRMKPKPSKSFIRK